MIFKNVLLTKKNSDSAPDPNQHKKYDPDLYHIVSLSVQLPSMIEVEMVCSCQELFFVKF